MNIKAHEREMKCRRKKLHSCQTAANLTIRATLAIALPPETLEEMVVGNFWLMEYIPYTSRIAHEMLMHGCLNNMRQSF